VYRGLLDGLPVAIKLLDMSGQSQQGVKEFQAEVGILSRLHHPHIVLLMGSCPQR
jgi:serine/threonine protein kinase